MSIRHSMASLISKIRKILMTMAAGLSASKTSCTALLSTVLLLKMSSLTSPLLTPCSPVSSSPTECGASSTRLSSRPSPTTPRSTLPAISPRESTVLTTASAMLLAHAVASAATLRISSSTSMLLRVINRLTRTTLSTFCLLRNKTTLLILSFLILMPTTNL